MLLRMPCIAFLTPATSAPGSEPHATADHQPFKLSGHTLLLSKVGTGCARIWKGSCCMQECERLQSLILEAPLVAFWRTIKLMLSQQSVISA